MSREAKQQMPSHSKRLQRAMSVRKATIVDDAVSLESGRSEFARWVAAQDPTSHVGSLHHTVPRFLLDRWASDGQVQVFSKIERKFTQRSIGSLAIRDFYTFIDQDGARNSLVESVLSEVEGRASVVLRGLLSAFSSQTPSVGSDAGVLADLLAFQIVRTMRRRREIELHVDWFAKTMAGGKVADEQLRQLTIYPHQNEVVEQTVSLARSLAPFIENRPLALVMLSSGALVIGDEPVLVNSGLEESGHHADCFLTDEQIEARWRKEQKRKLKKRRRVGRIVHFRSTAGYAVGVASELMLPVGPRAALWWGPLTHEKFTDTIDVERLDKAESDRLVALLNARTAEQSLDWIASTLGNDGFRDQEFPEAGPLMIVCDGENAASSAINAVPTQFRPQRLAKSK